MTDKKVIKIDASILDSLKKKYPNHTVEIDDEFDLNYAQPLSPESGARYATAEELANIKKMLSKLDIPDEE